MKSKKILTILLSLAIMFTFMPAMAFATVSSPANATDAWTADHTSVTVTFADKTTKEYKNIKRSWAWNGQGRVVAAIDWSDTTGVDETAQASEAFFDFNAAALLVNGTWGRTAFEDAISTASDGTITMNDVSIGVTKPDYVTDANVTGTKPSTGYIELTGDRSLARNNLEATVYVSGFDPKSYDAQEVTLTTVIAPIGSGEETATNATPFIGEVPQKNITVQAKDPDLNDVEFGVDKVSNGTEGPFYYDGKTHTIVNSTVPGLSVEYYVQDKTTKKYSKVDAVEFKDAGSYYAKAVVTNTTTKANLTKYFDFTVNPAGLVYVEFDKYSYNIAGTEFDPWDFVEVVASSDASDVLKKAVATDKAALKEAVKSVCEITQTPEKYDANVINLKLAPKADYDEAAFVKANKALFANFSASGVPFYSMTDSAVITTNAGGKMDDITFEGVTTKSYKAKKKTKKLAKTKTFTVVAKADSGKDVTYSMTSSSSKITINKTTGKVSVKKGLKKGTYTLKIKAKTAAGLGYRAAKETVTVKVKIK